ncbi:MAG: flagellin, partial [Verrucomicrobiota bacterium]
QDGAYKVADKVLSRMSELATLANDPTKNAGDIALYDKEFQNLQLQLVSLSTEEFNGVPLFIAGTGSSVVLAVSTSEDGAQTLGITQASINGGAIDNVLNISALTGASAPNDTVTIQNAIQYLADLRAQNGAEESRVNFAMDLLKINAINLEAANSRIIDVDVAAESTQLARYQILQQAGTAMLARPTPASNPWSASSKADRSNQTKLPRGPSKRRASFFILQEMKFNCFEWLSTTRRSSKNSRRRAERIETFF